MGQTQMVDTIANGLFIIMFIELMIIKRSGLFV